jgi:hypothetical protein
VAVPAGPVVEDGAEPVAELLDRDEGGLARLECAGADAAERVAEQRALNGLDVVAVLPVVGRAAREQRDRRHDSKQLARAHGSAFRCHCKSTLVGSAA